MPLHCAPRLMSAHARPARTSPCSCPQLWLSLGEPVPLKLLQEDEKAANPQPVWGWQTSLVTSPQSHSRALADTSGTARVSKRGAPAAASIPAINAASLTLSLQIKNTFGERQPPRTQKEAGSLEVQEGRRSAAQLLVLGAPWHSKRRASPWGTCRVHFAPWFWQSSSSVGKCIDPSPDLPLPRLLRLCLPE